MKHNSRFLDELDKALTEMASENKEKIKEAACTGVCDTLEGLPEITLAIAESDSINGG